MTEDELRTLGEWDWWYTGKPDCSVLHAAIVTQDPILEVGGNGVTQCGRKLQLFIPGIFSRMGLPRCKRCCTRLGWPQGIGSPKNDALLRPLVEARLFHVKRSSEPTGS